MERKITKKLLQTFKTRRYFNRKELFDFYNSFEPGVKERTVDWRIYKLKSDNIIKPVKRGIYTISDKPDYLPKISDQHLKIAKKLINHFSEIDYCTWSTEWLSEFTVNQATNNLIIIEVEKEFIESVFYYLKDNVKNNVYIEADQKTINYYVFESIEPIVIKKLITRSPTRKIKTNHLLMNIPTLEKILVDIFTDNKLFSHYQDSELRNIFEIALQNYPINFTKLFSYAARREKGKKLKAYFETHLRYLLDEIPYD